MTGAGGAAEETDAALGPAAWLRDEAWRLATTTEFVGELCRRLNASGIPVARLNCHIRYLDPEIIGVSYFWTGATGAVTELPIQPEMRQRATFLDSPMAPILLGRERVVRANLEAASRPGEWPLLTELRELGLTDYIIFAMPFSDGTVSALSVATEAPGGFPPGAVAGLKTSLPAIGRIMELHALRRLSTILLDAYVGRRSGARILDGRIRLGDLERIDAVLWFSDLRGSTQLAARLDPARYVETLNGYFEATAGTVLAEGGEVLKFIGDGVMAAFPIEGEPAETVAATALNAAREALRKMAELEPVEGARLRCGIGLHRGAVLYGNVGVRQRLDFTVTGTAANVVTRVEGLCRDLGEPLLASVELARLLPDAFIPAGQYALRGVGESVAIYRPAP